MTTNQERAAEAIDDWQVTHSSWGTPRQLASALADAGLLRPELSKRYDGDYRTAFVRHENGAEGPYIDAVVGSHHPSPTFEKVYRAEVNIQIDSEHGYHALYIHAAPEWCREAAAVLLDVAKEADRKNEEKADE